LKKDPTLAERENISLKSLFHKYRSKKSFKFGNGGSEKAESDDSDEDNLHIVTYTPIVGFDEESRNNFRSAVLINLSRNDSDAMRKSAFDIAQATPKPQRNRLHNFNYQPYYPISGDLRSEDYNLRIQKSTAMPTGTEHKRDSNTHEVSDFSTSVKSGLDRALKQTSLKVIPEYKM